ncbi:hypothetical protein D3C75_1145760 [compost metagenome]
MDQYFLRCQVGSVQYYRVMLGGNKNQLIVVFDLGTDCIPVTRHDISYTIRQVKVQSCRSCIRDNLLVE